MTPEIGVCLRDLRRWVARHWSTCGFICIHFVISILMRFFGEKMGVLLPIVRLFGSSRVEYVVVHVIFAVAFCGVPVSVGHLQWCLWMAWCAVCVFCVRLALGVACDGPTYIVFAQYFAFVVIHRPFMKMRLFRLRMTDTWLYSIAVLQYLLSGFMCLVVDMFVCVVANVAWNGANRLLHLGAQDTNAGVP